MRYNATGASLGRALRDAGSARVKLNAGDGWREDYGKVIQRWFGRLRVGTCFSSETLRRVASVAGVREPHHYNAWSAMAGGCIRKWLIEGAVKIQGSGHAQRASSHATRTVIYRKLAR